MEIILKNTYYRLMDPEILRPFLTNRFESTDFEHLGKRHYGKVRDVYVQADTYRILVATDRQSAFDKLWCTIPLKGQVLTQISAWWFDKIADIIPTHVIDLPDPNVMIVKDLKMIPVEIVVRGYLTGSTKTSAWVNYEKGVRNFCGNLLPDGMVKNQRFDSPIITPTTKSDDDELIDPKGIIERGLATKDQWDEISQKALALFVRGQEIAKSKGLILVDTKYEMGLDASDVLTIADEVHTPDSSRYWIDGTTESLDKEFFRLWLRDQGFEYGKKEPKITDSVRLELAQKYINLFEKITGETFVPPDDVDIENRIRKNLQKYTI